MLSGQLATVHDSSKPRLSSEEAVSIALNAVKDFSWKAVGIDNGT